MTRPQVFQCGPGAPFSPRFQDMLREAMIRDIPKHLRPRRPKDTVTSNSGKARKAAAQRAKDAPRIMELRATGASHAAIGAAIGLASATVRRIIQEHGQ